MATQVNIINECRAICISGRLNNSNANLWMKCQTLGENWGKADTDESINVAITEIDVILSENDSKQDPFTLALLLMRANLENSLKSNNHMNESATIYFNFVRSVIERTEDHFIPQLKENKHFLSNLSILVQNIRQYLLLHVDNSITLLKNVIIWVNADNETLTPFHSQLCLLALATRNPDSILEILQTSFKSIHPSLQDIKEYLLFYYYSAILSGIQQNWKSMQFNLEQAVTVPSIAYSQIIIDAYKKFILVCFLRGVHVQTALPKYTTNSRQHQVLAPERQFSKSSSQPSSASNSSQAQNGFCNIRVYYNFVKMCQEGKEKTISPEMIQVLQEDNNYSLAQMSLKQHIKNRIIRLKDIFITAKLTDVAKRVNLTQVQTENLIKEMVDRREIKAEIEMHENSRIVSFGTDDSKSEEERLHKEIGDKSQITEGLMNRITNMDRNIQVMPKYIKSCDTSDEKNYTKMNN